MILRRRAPCRRLLGWKRRSAAAGVAGAASHDAKRQSVHADAEIIGEILRDAGGRLYEKLGDTVRPVSQLFTGPHGEMIDLAPVRT